MSRANQLLASLPISTPDGVFVASYSSAGLCALDFPSKNAQNFDPVEKPEPTVQKWHQLTTDAVQAAISGVPVKRLPPLDLQAGTEFQRAVWKVLLSIAPGETRSYAQVASAIGSPKATRAVGGACGANPIPLLIPCHRVLAAGQKLGGFSGGLHWKRLLLGRERNPTPFF